MSLKFIFIIIFFFGFFMLFFVFFFFKFLFCLNNYFDKNLYYSNLKNIKTIIIYSEKSLSLEINCFDTVIILDNVKLKQSLILNKPMQLVGLNKPIIDGNFISNNIVIKSNNIIVNNLIIINSGRSSLFDYSGILIENSYNCKIKNNTLSNNSFSIYLANSCFCIISNNIIIGNVKNEINSGNGIHLWKSNYIYINNNIIKNNRDGIYIEFSKFTFIKNNISLLNIRYGLHFMFSSHGLYKFNFFLNNQTGVAVMFSNNIKMFYNNFIKCWGNSSYGLLLKDINDSYIIGNKFFSNTKALFIDGCNRNKFIFNIFSYNGYVIDIWGNSEDNIFFDNNFFFNYFDIFTNAKIIKNNFNKNYWTKALLIDINHDYICDIIYRPTEVFSLWFFKYNELAVLLNSLVINFLEYTEKVYPIFITLNLIDNFPLFNMQKNGVNYENF